MEELDSKVNQKKNHCMGNLSTVFNLFKQNSEDIVIHFLAGGGKDCRER